MNKMNNNKIIILVLISLVLTVPWWFFEKSTQLLGLPSWALFSTITATLLSLVLSILIQTYWPKEDSGE